MRTCQLPVTAANCAPPPCRNRQHLLGGYTLIELLVVIAIISVLGTMLFPTFTLIRDQARGVACISNLNQIGLAVAQYQEDNDGDMPLGAVTEWPGAGAVDRWYWDMRPYLRAGRIGFGGVFVCPSDPGLTTMDGGYGINANLVSSYRNGVRHGRTKNEAEIADTAGTFLVCDAARLDPARLSHAPNSPKSWRDIELGPVDYAVTPPSGWTGEQYYVYGDSALDTMDRPVGRHRGALNVVYCDSHCQSVPIGQFLGPLPGGWPHGDLRNCWDDQ